MRKLIEGLAELEDYKEAIKLRSLLANWDKRKTDVHTEHCCLSCHYCKYRDENCTVLTGKLKQSYSCEDCARKEKKEKFIDSLIAAALAAADPDDIKQSYEGTKKLEDNKQKFEKLRKEFMDNYSSFED